MRISGGEAKGRTLNFPSRSNQRPTTDFLREALFNVLRLPADQSFLDLFAGSGSVGLEALSRKAKNVTFVEKSKALVGVIHENILLCGYSEKCQIIHADIQSALRDLYRRKCRFNVVFADPPYNQGLIGGTLKGLNEYPVLQEEGTIILQHSVREQLTSLTNQWFVMDQRKYGDNLLTFIRMGNV
ncbi:MAG TPA: 16S rRNA (guanine(966)-N(2))-methyltransferase RsmD [Smithellaceae bacterium]|nr:16S rRNA (guanine(966)-N(2))-methyltransferase RsmD [Smithellaceae bacterium]HPE06533.1 16S rRNA (guanine(966)-N(2))-methyltransferase RsmD [Smithellaceae bacterium]HRY37196.1 16S rRNA (guanine(966)-N(2))-methyltransferase RsmD [Smithellaceae bacterium]